MLSTALAPDAQVSVSNIDVARDPETQSAVARITLVNKGGEAAQAPLVVTSDGRRAAVELIPLAPGETKTTEVALPKSAANISAQILQHDAAVAGAPGRHIVARDLRPKVDVSVEELSVSTLQFDPKRSRQVTISFRVTNNGTKQSRRRLRSRFFPAPFVPGRRPN